MKWHKSLALTSWILYNKEVIKGDTMIEGFVLTLALMTFCIGSSCAIVNFASKGRFF